MMISTRFVNVYIGLEMIITTVLFGFFSKNMFYVILNIDVQDTNIFEIMNHIMIVSVIFFVEVSGIYLLIRNVEIYLIVPTLHLIFGFDCMLSWAMYSKTMHIDIHNLDKVQDDFVAFTFIINFLSIACGFLISAYYLDSKPTVVSDNKKTN